MTENCIVFELIATVFIKYYDRHSLVKPQFFCNLIKYALVVPEAPAPRPSIVF